MAAEKCSRCSAPMVSGYIPDRSNAAVFMSSWVEGEPEKSFWFGHNLKGKEVRALRACRCSGCGFIDLYAP